MNKEKEGPVYVQRSTYTPPHMRRRKNASRNGTVGPEKTKAFRTAAQLSKRFIHQSAAALEHPRLASEYAAYKARCDRNGLRGS
jgi:hypothetical protein